MRQIFDMNNPVMAALATAADLLILQILTALCCVPVVTAGAALAAMDDVLMRMVRAGEGSIPKEFFRAFARNGKQATVLWLLLLLTAALLYADYLAAAVYVPMLRVVIAAMGAAVFMVALYAFPLLARYENTLRATLKNAVALTVGFFPRTLGMAAATAGLWALCLRFPQIGAPLLLLFGFSLPGYLCALLLRPVFDRLEQPQGKKD